MPQVSSTIDKFLRSQALSGPEKTTITTAIGAVPTSRTITASGLVSGGGALSSNIIISVSGADSTDVGEGSLSSVAVTPVSQPLRFDSASGLMACDGTFVYGSSYGTQRTTSFGMGAQAYNYDSAAFGYLSSAAYPFATAVGSSSMTGGFAASSFGYRANPAGDFATSVGAFSYASFNGTAFGYNSQCFSASAAIGAWAQAFTYGSAFGYGSKASADGGVALGYNMMSQYEGDIEIGSQFYYNRIARLSGSTYNGCWHMTYGVGNEPNISGTTNPYDAFRSGRGDLLDGMLTFFVDTSTHTLKTIVNIGGTKYSWSQNLNLG